MNEKKYEEPSVTYNSVVNAPSCFKLFECGKNFFNNIDAMSEWAFMETLKKNYDIECLRYEQACMLDPKEMYYT